MLTRTLLAVALVSLLVAAPAPACTGDCSGDGAVSIGELIVQVNVALGVAAVTACQAGDANGDGAIRVEELIAAVNAALGGCVVDPDALPAAVLELLRTTAQLPALADGLSVAIDGLGGPEPCELGGGLTSTCEESGSGSLRTLVDADACRVQTAEGPHRYDGRVTAIASGQCPDVIEIDTLRFDFGWRFIAEAADGSAALTAATDFTAVFGPLLFGDPPCAIKGGGATTNGDIDYRFADGRKAGLLLDETVVAVEFFDFVGSCDPTRLVTDIDGRVEAGDGLLAGTAAARLDLRLDLTLETRTLDVSGSADLPAGGRVTLSTPEPLVYPLGASCFAGGVLRIAHAGGTTELRFPGGGAVAIDRDGDGTVDRTDPDCL